MLKTERRFFVRKIATKYFRDFQGSSIADVLSEQSIHKPSALQVYNIVCTKPCSIPLI